MYSQISIGLLTRSYSTEGYFRGSIILNNLFLLNPEDRNKICFQSLFDKNLIGIILFERIKYVVIIHFCITLPETMRS